MRDVLFRGKRKYNEEWVEGFYFFKRGKYKGDKTFVYEEHMITTGIEETSGAYGETTEVIEFKVIPESVSEFTGLTDKNGNKIFEGDIVRQDYSKIINARYDTETLGFIDADDIEGHHIGVVKISPHNGVGMRNPMSYDDINDTQQKTKRFVNLASYRCEVIGNIHDNPELLKGGAE